MSLLSDFRDFAVKGNVMDLAVGVIIGAAFGKIVDSLVNDLIMPVAGALFGGLDFSNILITLAAPPAGVARTYAELKKAGVPFIAVGNFVGIALNFIILAFIVFMLVKLFRHFQRRDEKQPAPPREEVVLLREIRDALKGSVRNA